MPGKKKKTRTGKKKKPGIQYITIPGRKQKVKRGSSGRFQSF